MSYNSGNRARNNPLHRLQSIALLVLLLVLSGLNQSCQQDETDCSKILFGIPNERTGLSDEECRPVCECTGYIPRTWSQTEIDELKTWTLVNSPESLVSNPYDDALPASQSGVCAIKIVDRTVKTYSLQDYADEASAQADGAIVTHHGICGLCSPLQDLAVYLENRDLGTAVRLCGILNFTTPFSELQDCIEQLGFSEPCANIWAYNTRNTQAACTEPCVAAILSELFGEIIPYNNPDGTLGDCIACDEEISGPIFKAYAARTRRNSGLPSGICRFCDGVIPVSHHYGL